MMNWVKVEFYVAPDMGLSFDFTGVALLPLAERLARAVGPEAAYVDGVTIVRASEHYGLAHVVRPPVECVCANSGAYDGLDFGPCPCECSDCVSHCQRA